MERPPSSDPTTHPCDHLRTSPPDGPTTCLSPPTLWADCTVDRPLQKPLSKTTVSRTEPTRRPSEIEKTTLKLTPKCSPETLQSPNNPRPQCPPDTPQPPAKTRSHCPPDTRQSPINSRPQAPDTSQPPSDSRPECRPEILQPPNKTKPQCRPDTSQCIIKPRPQCPPDTPQPPNNPRPQCCPDTLKPPHNTRPQCSPITQQSPNNPRPQCPPETSQPPNNPRPQCPPDTRQPPNKTKPQCRPDTSQRPIKPRFQCPPDTPQPPNSPRPQCCPYTSLPPFKPRPQWHRDTPQPVLEAVSSDSVRRPSYLTIVMQSDSVMCVVGVAPPSSPPCVQKPDPSTGSTAVNKARGGLTYDANRTCGSELEPKRDEAGRQLHPGIGVSQGDRPHTPTEEDDAELVIPLDEDGSDDDQNRKKKKRLLGKRRREQKAEEPLTCDLDPDLERALEDGAKQHNLTAVNVRNILHEVITNEHVVAMMKAAITETEGQPLFEPKMTRSKLKEVVEKGVVIPNWNLSPIKKSSKQQFVNIPLEEEDSSGEEYQPEEEDEDETAEESVLESDVESTASSPRGHKRMRVHHLSELQEEDSVDGQQQGSPGRHINAESVPMGPPPPPRTRHILDHTFMEKLHAVEEELDSHPVAMDSLQSLDASLIAFRTRSKKTLKNVPIGQLEAELRAPDTTPDMYEGNTADDDDWKDWLCGLMRDDMGNDDEADDDDDPEYNILEDWDEPDTEDLRNDRAVRITKKEVNELMEELFETFQDEMGISHHEDMGADDEDSNMEPLPDFNTPQAIRLEEPLLTDQHRTVRAQLEYLRLRKSLLTKTEDEKFPARESQTHAFRSAPKLPPVMSLDAAQRKRLQQQMQQHIQLLTQLHLLSFRNPKLRAEADTAHMYLAELSTFAESSALTHSPVNPNFQSMFQTCNLKEALELIPMVKSQVPEDMEPPKPRRKNANDSPNLPKHIAWTLATRSVFMYPELLPVCAMKPRGPQDKVFFTKAEDNLLALGLKHFEGIEYSKQLISKYLVTAKTAQQLTVRMKNLTMKKAPDNIIKLYKKTKMLPALSRCCEDVLPHDARPPVEREKHRLPFWIKASLSSIEAEMKSADSRYPLILPPGVSLTLKPLPKHLHRKFWRQRRTILKPLLIRPNPVPKQVTKPPIQPAVSIQGIVNMQPLGAAPLGRKVRSATCVSAFSHTIFAATETQVLLPHAASQRSRKSLICASPKRKTEALGGRRTPTLQSAPVVFSVPHGVLKLVSLGTACGVLQPLSTGSAAPVTAVLLNPTPVPLIQMAAPPPCSQTMSRPSGQKSEDDEWECVSITIKVEGEAEETALQGTGPSSDVTEHVTSKEKEPDVVTQSPPSVPLHSLAASPISKTEDSEEVKEEVNQTQNTEAAGNSPKDTPPSTDGDVEISSPAGVQRDSSSPMDGQDLGNDKDAPEEEEDEDFDDLTQDEDEMSSEESVLSVPELQETMEKLTWLASERRLSQEGDSEDNSQEENTEPEEEEEEEGVDGSSQKPEEMTDEAGDEKLLSNHHRAPSPAPVETNMAPTERRRGVSKAQSSHRARGKRGRTRASKDASKLLLLYDEKILTKDPLREQKDMAFAQSYLNRVREALHSAPGTYQQFLNLIYEFETKGDGKTAVHLYERLRLLLHDWPQLLKDFAAFLLPEQALECGLFEEQQAFDKSRRFLRQLEICFLENPAQHHKIIKLLQSCAECPLQEMGKLKTQMWQLLKGHMHLQEEFSLFFDQLRPPTSRMDDFEVMNWTEDKEYTFDGFEEVTIPDVEEEEEQNKLSAPPRSKRRKDASHGPDKDADWPDGGKECPCSCHDVVVEQRMKRCKRRMCTPCTSKACNSRSQRSSDAGASTIKDAGDSRLPLPKSTSSEERPSAGGTQESSVSGQRSRSGADPGKGRHQVKVTSSRGGRRPHAVKSVVVEKVQRCPSPSETEAPATSSPPCSPPTTSSALCLNPTPEDPSILQVAAQEQTLTVCAKNIKVSSSGEKVVVWTREADRVILTMCQERGAQDDTFSAISAQLGNKSPSEVSQRFRELINLFQTGSVTSSDDEEEGTDLVSEEED